MVEQVMVAALIDLDGSFWVQLVSFLLLWGLLFPILFKPYLKAQRAREDLTEGRIRKADQIEKKADKLWTAYQEQMKVAKKQGEEEWRRLREEGARTRDELIATERERINAQVAKELEDLERTREQLEAQTKAVAGQLKVLIQERIMEVEG